jgi:hypothetical protein
LNYYEIHDPYYALIKAQSREEAINTYIKEIEVEENENYEYAFIELPKELALLKFGQSVDQEGKTMDPEEILELFSSNEPCLLLVDGALL